MLFFLFSAALWVIGVLMGAPGRVRAGMVGMLYLAVLLGHAVLPAGNPIVALFGGSLGGWLVLGGVAGLIWAYGAWVASMKGRHKVDAPASNGTFSEAELNRYARHIVLREIGGAGQKNLKEARVLVIGAGGLGAPALMYLAGAGVGTLGVIDDDRVSASNLSRQVIFDDEDTGTAKVAVAKRRINAQNPYVSVLPYERRLTEDIAADLVADYDLVIDGTDNFETRYLVNRTCAAAGIPLISGALSQWEGQVSVFDPARGGPCYQCVFPEAPAPELAPSCAEAGVLSPLPGVIGSMMAVEAVKLITGAGASLRGEMLIFDALYGETRRIALKRRRGCGTCGILHPATDTP